MSKSNEVRLPWMPLHIDDHLRLTRGWPVAAVGIYCRLIVIQWLDESLPAAESELYRISGAMEEEWNSAWPYIESRFQVVDGRRRDPDIAALREDACHRYNRRSSAGASAARARWGP